MRFLNFLNEWRVEKKYAGRGIINLKNANNIILWYYMKHPSSKGLIWTTSDGTTYIDKKKIKKINYPIEKMTHKKQLAELYDELEIGKYMDGSLRDNVEELNETNPRGRILDNTIYVYEFDNNKLNDRAIDEIYRIIPEDTKISESSKLESAGIVLTDGKKFLASISTGSGNVGVPKGMREKNEDYKKTAIREFYEETGKKVNGNELEYLGKFYFRDYKDLILFKYKVDKLPNISEYKCLSYTKSGFKEISSFKYIDIDNWTSLSRKYHTAFKSIVSKLKEE